MSIGIILSLLLLGLVLLLAFVLPSVTSRTVPFGVRIPAHHAADPVVAGQARIYRWRVLVSGIVVTVLGVGTFTLTGQPLLLPVSVLVLIGVWYWCFFMANQGIRSAKAAGGWYEGVHQGIAIDTGLRTNPPRYPWVWLAGALAVVVVTTALGALMYPAMPSVLAVHYGANGVPNRVVTKSVGAAFSLVFVQLGISALLGGAAFAIARSRPDIDPAHPASSARWSREYMTLGAKVLLGLLTTINLAMLGSSLLMWTGTVTAWAPLVVALPILAAVAVTIAVLARKSLGRDTPGVDTGLAHRDDDKFWRSGLFYINKEDHALLVPRRFGIGWTVNLGNPRAAFLLAGILAVISLILILRFDS